jgi:hypothetical protein
MAESAQFRQIAFPLSVTRTMDDTAIIKFVENRFIGSAAHLTNRDAAQPNLLDFFDFNAVPWADPPAPPTASSASACNAGNL